MLLCVTQWQRCGYPVPCVRQGQLVVPPPPCPTVSAKTSGACVHSPRMALASLLRPLDKLLFIDIDHVPYLSVMHLRSRVSYAPSNSCNEKSALMLSVFSSHALKQDPSHMGLCVFRRLRTIKS